MRVVEGCEGGRATGVVGDLRRLFSLWKREGGPARAVGCEKGLGGEGATGAVSLGGEGPTGAVGCGREGATLGGGGSTGTVGCGEREGSVNVLSRLATAAPWTATRRRMASKDGYDKMIFRPVGASLLETL